MARCACGNPECRIEICADSESSDLNIYGPNGELIIMYLDANGTVKLIHELKEYLLKLAELQS